MKKILIFASAAMMAACNSGNDTAKVESMGTGTDSSARQNITYPYEIQYSSKFEIGDPQQGKIILDLWKDWDNGNLANSKNSFADSVEMHFSNGSMMHSTRDSIIAAGQSYRDMYASAVSKVYSIIPLKSTDKNENWVGVWGMETDTDKKGKVDSFYLQETWRFNKAGKADLLYQYRAEANPPKK